MNERQEDWMPGLVCTVTVACMGEERGRQTGVTGQPPVALCLEAGGLCRRLAVVDEERLLSQLVSHHASPLSPLDKDVWVPSPDSPQQVHPLSNTNPCRGHSAAEGLS